MNITNQTIFRSLFTGTRRGLLAAGLLLLGSTAQAMPLDLILKPFPDIVSTFVNVSYTYTAATDQFMSHGYAFELNDDGSAEAIVGGTFDLIATITNLGVMSGGSLTIGGTVPTLGFGTGTILTGNLTDFGFQPAGGDPLEFRFDITGGDAAGLFGGNGPGGGVIMSGTGFNGSFMEDFSSSSGVADTGVVPEPATVWLIGSGLLLVGLGRRRRLA